MSPLRATVTVVLVPVLLALAVPPAPAFDVELGRYRAGGGGGRVRGRAVAERLRASAPDAPMTDVVFTLVPRSEQLVRRLEEIRRGTRDSMAKFRTAARDMRRERDNYERTLWEAGAADLVFSTLAGADGGFSFDGVPPGDWLLFGWRARTIDKKAARVSARDRQRFAVERAVDGYELVLVWLRNVSVGDGAEDPVELTDRNAWFTGVVESGAPSAGP